MNLKLAKISLKDAKILLKWSFRWINARNVCALYAPLMKLHVREPKRKIFELFLDVIYPSILGHHINSSLFLRSIGFFRTRVILESASTCKRRQTLAAPKFGARRGTSSTILPLRFSGFLTCISPSSNNGTSPRNQEVPLCD